VLSSKIILVDGMPGTGKSTAAQFIGMCAQCAGSLCRWHHEERSAHPVRLFYDPERHRSGAEYAKEAESQWVKFSEEVQADESTAILDAAVLQNHVRSMLCLNVGATKS